MLDLSQSEINDIRKSGYRPQVIGITTNDSKVLFVYHKEYDLWMFPQGGIDNGESLEVAFWREMGEELGNEFVDKFDRNLNFILEDQSTFPPAKQGSRSLKTDDGQDIFMKGKVYFVLASESSTTELDIEKTEFDHHKWTNYEEAQELIDSIYQRGKQRITRQIVDELKSKNLIK
ncbi:NUDIX domain-containing protein [Candidatus Uhrbacteria bacterium]|jgi:putative (di)nucleoside polyphosphate hydrolase|nr:NUDIX domain-containing protein [Candidatus Uhrbacteria bacterium]MBT7717308.1 NUDIX domain-containing protein [Candidatus Uhrbacteria bacterium]